MKRFILFVLAVLVLAAQAFAQPGQYARPIEEVIIGGGPGDAVDGGAWIDKAGSACFSGTASAQIIVVTELMNILGYLSDTSIDGTLTVYGDIVASTGDLTINNATVSNVLIVGGTSAFTDTIEATAAIKGATLYSSGPIYVGESSAGDDDYIYADQGNQYLMWDDGNSLWDFSIGVSAGTFWGKDSIYVGSSGADDDDSLYFDNAGSEFLMWDNDPGEFALSDDFVVDGTCTATGFEGYAGAMTGIDGFGTINCPNGTNPVADAIGDILNVTSTGGTITWTGTEGTDTLNSDVTDDAIDGAQLADSITLDAPLSVDGEDVTIGENLRVTDGKRLYMDGATGDNYLDVEDSAVFVAAASTDFEIRCGGVTSATFDSTGLTLQEDLYLIDGNSIESAADILWNGGTCLIDIMSSGETIVIGGDSADAGENGTAIGFDAWAYGNESTAIGGIGTTAGGNNSFAAGGDHCEAWGADSFVTGNNVDTATAALCSFAAGKMNENSGAYSFLYGYEVDLSGNHSACFGTAASATSYSEANHFIMHDQDLLINMVSPSANELGIEVVRNRGTTVFSVDEDGDVYAAGLLEAAGGITSVSGAWLGSHIILGDNAADDDDIIYFDMLTETFMWDNDPGEFALSDDLNVTGDVSASGDTYTTGTAYLTDKACHPSVYESGNYTIFDTTNGIVFNVSGTNRYRVDNTGIWPYNTKSRSVGTTEKQYTYVYARDVYGSRTRAQFIYDGTMENGTHYMDMSPGLSCSATQGVVADASGSIVGYSICAETVDIASFIVMNIKKNNATVWPINLNGGVIIYSGQQAYGTDTFVAGDVFQIEFDCDGANDAILDPKVWLTYTQCYD